MSIGKKLLALRKNLGLSQEDMAKDLHVSRQTISKWESDLSLPDMKTILLIGELYHVSVTELLGIDENKDDSITKLYEQVSIVSRKLEEGQKRRTIFSVVLMGICVLCLFVSIFILFKKNIIVVNRHYQENVVSQVTPEVLEMGKMNVHFYDLETLKMNVDIRASVNQEYLDSTVQCYMKDDKGKEYKYDMIYQDNNTFLYQGDIPLKNYEIINVLLKTKENHSYKNDVVDSEYNSRQYVDEVIHNFVHFVFPKEEKVSKHTNRQYHEVDFQNLKYLYYNELVGIYDDDNKYKGHLQGKVHIHLTGEKNKTEAYDLDETFDLGEEKSFKLKRKLENLETVSLQMTVTLDGEDYMFYENKKLVDSYGLIQDVVVF